MLFDLTHSLYMLISALLTAVILVILGKYVKSERARIITLRVITVTTLVIHYSVLYVDFFRTGEAFVYPSLILLVFPCHICMWGVLLVAFLPNRQSQFYRMLTEFCFYAILLCGTFGIMFNENYAKSPTLTDYFVLKGLVSHSTMILSGIYLLTGKFMKIRVRNVLSCLAGLAFFVVDGTFINFLYWVFGLEPCNSMYLQHAPYAGLPWLNVWTIGVASFCAVFIFTIIYEAIALPKEERWLTKLRAKRDQKL